MRYFKEKPISPSLSIFGHNSFFKGTIIFKEEARIAGRVEGFIQAEEYLILEESSYVQGELEAVKVEISGTFKGKLTILDTLHLTASARVEGEISANKLIVEEGAQLRGHLLQPSGAQKIERELAEAQRA